MNLKIVFISDTHNQHRKAHLPEGDILIHGGDVSNGRKEQLLDFLDWFAEQPHPYKIFIGGNMDRDLERNPEFYRARLPQNTYYLENQSLELEGIHFWGSPMVPRFVGAFNRERGAELRRYWEKIPEEVDVLITHTPPKGILDRTSLGLSVGCADLRERVGILQPTYHLFGHVHEAFGRQVSAHTTFINASFVRRFRAGNEPFVLEWPVG